MDRLLNKIFTFKGNRQFSEAEDVLIDGLNNTENFIADEAFIEYSNTSILAIDKEEKKFLQISNATGKLQSEIVGYSEIESYQLVIKDRLNEDWMEGFNKWKRQKKFIRTIHIELHTTNNNTVILNFFKSENNEGSRTSTIPVKRALFSLDKWDQVLFDIMEKREATENS